MRRAYRGGRHISKACKRCVKFVDVQLDIFSFFSKQYYTTTDYLEIDIRSDMMFSVQHPVPPFRDVFISFVIVEPPTTANVGR